MTWGPFKEKRADEPRRCMILSHAADGEDLAMKNDIDSRREREDPQVKENTRDVFGRGAEI
jgi:hypothetical protein